MSIAIAAGKISAASLTIPVAGWIVAGIVLLGAGLFLAYQALMAKDSPHEIWISRTYFGNPIREGLFSSGDIVFDTFKNLPEELSGYYNLTFSPMLIENPDKTLFLTDEQKAVLDQNIIYPGFEFLPPEEQIEIANKMKKMREVKQHPHYKVADTDWEENGWNKDKVRFTFLLPAFNPKLSDWTYHINNYEEDDVESSEDILEAKLLENNLKADSDEIILKQKDEGMYVYLAKTFNNSDAQSAALNIKYWPNGHSKEPVTQTFYLDD